MRKMKEVTKVENVVYAFVCNKCGKEVDLEKAEKDGNYEEVNLFHPFSVSFGFGSDYDFEEWSFDLCENCLLEFVKTFKIQPDRGEYLLK